MAKQIAHAHVLFNGLGVLVALPFTHWMAEGMLRLIPDKTRTVAVPVPVATDSEVGPTG